MKTGTKVYNVGHGFVSGALYLMNSTMATFMKGNKGPINMYRLRVLYEYLGLCLCDYEEEQKFDYDIDKVHKEACDLYEKYRG